MARGRRGQRMGNRRHILKSVLCVGITYFKTYTITKNFLTIRLQASFVGNSSRQDLSLLIAFSK